MKKNSSSLTESRKSDLPTRSKIDRDWYIGQLKARKLTQRAFAQKTGLHLTSVIRLLGGNRDLKIEEIPVVANVLGVSVEEVLRHSGLDDVRFYSAQDSAGGGAFVAPREPSLGELAIEGWVDGELDVHFGRPAGRSVAPLISIPSAFEGRDKGLPRVLRLQTIGSAYSALDGALVYYLEGQGGATPVQFNDALCVVETESGGIKLRVLHRGYERGVFNLADMAGRIKETGVKVRAAHPVFQILFGGEV